MAEENNRLSNVRPQKVEHSRAKVFERGQVWYWEDPIYQSKDRGMKVDIGEVGTRYSRYVVIIQDPTTSTKCNIVVVPCSSKNGTIHDVEIPIDQLYCDQHSYAKVQNIMPVHPRTLTRYICTIPDEALKAIDAEILKMFAPYIRQTWSDRDIKELFGIDMGVSTIGWYQHHHESISRYVSAFIKTCVIFTSNPDDRISVQKLKEAFDLFCLKRNYVLDFDTVELIDCMCHLWDSKEEINVRNVRESLLDVIAFAGGKLKNDALTLSIEPTPLKSEEPAAPQEPVSNPESDDSLIDEKLVDIIKMGMQEEKFAVRDIMAKLHIGANRMRVYTRHLESLGVMIPSSMPKRPRGIDLKRAKEVLCDKSLLVIPTVATTKAQPLKKKPYGYWTLERKREFLKDCESMGIEAAAQKHDLTFVTARNYYADWQRFNPEVSQSEVKQEPEQESSHDITSIPSFPPRIDNIHRGVSTMSNIISDFLRHKNSYTNHSEPDISEADFYSRLSTTIYFGLLQYINVFVPRGGKPKLPKDADIIKNVDLWWFFSMLHNDMALNGMKDYTNLCKIYEERYHRPATIPSAAIETINKRIIRSGLCNTQHSAELCSWIAQRFCK